jgi:hypothetical protein
MAKPKSREMLFVLTAHAHRHVWAPCDVTAEDIAHDPRHYPRRRTAPCTACRPTAWRARPGQ